MATLCDQSPSRLTGIIPRHAQQLQRSLWTLCSCVEAAQAEHDKLDNHNKFLQRYIGDLMSTSKITVTGRGKV
jgi:hypothetical protein